MSDIAANRAVGRNRVLPIDGKQITGGSVTRAALAPDVRAAVGASARQGNRAVFLGNSITAVSGSSTRYPGDGWLGMLSVLSGGRIRPVGWAATGGQNSSALLARFDADVTPNAPDYVFVQEITNDVEGLTFAQTKANFAAIWDKCLAIGALPIQMSPPPKGSNTAEVIRRASWLQVECRKRGIPYVDIIPALIDPATGAMVASYAGGDGIHPQKEGHQVIAQTAWSVLAPLFPASGAVPLARYKGDPLNLLPNGLFIGDTNSDAVADGWVKNGPGTPTIEAGSDGVLGNWQTITVSSAGLTYINSNAISTGFAAGDRLLFSARIKTTVASGFTVSLRVDYNAVGTILRQYFGANTDQDGVVSMELAIPSGTTSLYVVLIGSPSGTGVMSIAQVSIRNLTAEGLA